MRADRRSRARFRFVFAVSGETPESLCDRVRFEAVRGECERRRVAIAIRRGLIDAGAFEDELAVPRRPA